MRMENLPAQKTTPSGQKSEGGLKPKISTMEIICAWCKKGAIVRKRGKKTQTHCGNSCASHAKNARPDIKAAIRAKLRKPLVHKVCEWCQMPYAISPRGKDSAQRRFCSQSCAAQWSMTQPGRADMSRQAALKAQASNRGRKRPDQSLRMTLNNPMSSFTTREKMAATLRGRPFPVERGGNGKLTVPQKTLAHALGWKTEYAIPTRDARSKFLSLPSSYKVDLAHQERAIAIEIDGAGHKGKQKLLDAKKEEVLSFLGWKVLRFSNQEVLEHLEQVCQAISQYIAST